HFQPCAGERGVDFVAWVILEVARGPLPHVAAHIERAEGTAPESVASGFKDPPLFPLPGVRQIRSPFLSPWVDATVSPARREFPFGFGRQTLFRPSRVCVRVAP